MKALGPSKWTKIEHFLCSSLPMTWRGWALIFDQIMANVIESTKPLSGFKGRTALASTDHPEGFVAFGGQCHPQDQPPEFHALKTLKTTYALKVFP